MKRVAVIVVALISAAVVLVAGTAASSGGDGGTYQVRAVFDTAFSVISGEDVKVAGVKVGKVAGLEVTPDNRAAVILDIQDPGFQNFRKDASCRIRPQSLIGERFVECTPTQPRAPGQPLPPPLPAIAKGHPGAGEHYLPVTQTQHEIDLDLVNNVMTLPYRQRLSLLVNELGVGLAGNGAALNGAIRRADPALQELDKVLNILASQNRTLANLARDSDTVLAPLAAKRQNVADFIVKANKVAVASARHSSDIEKSIQLFPAALQQLRPTMVRLGALSDQMAPVVEDLGSEAPALNRFIQNLGPFSQAGIPALTAAGKAAKIGTVALPKTTPILRDISTLAAQARPLASNLRQTLESLRDTGGIERALDYAFFQVAAINGFDSVGHYLRAGLIVNTCSTYATTVAPQCSARFQDERGASSAPRALTARQQAAYRAKLRAQIAARRPKQPRRSKEIPPQLAPPSSSGSGGSSAQKTSAKAPLKLPSVLPASSPAPKPAAPAPSAPAPSASPTGASPAQDQLLEYLLGGGS
jgi:ABC-type transporter Mla subunit MlaD